jgi:hypothetical protein
LLLSEDANVHTMGDAMDHGREAFEFVLKSGNAVCVLSFLIH